MPRCVRWQKSATTPWKTESRKLEIVTENFLEKIRTEFVAGTTTYDIVVNQINWVQAGARTGMFLPISDYMKRDGVSRDDYLDSSSWEVNGIMYGLAFLGGGDAIYFNKDLFDKRRRPVSRVGHNLRATP